MVANRGDIAPKIFDFIPFTQSLQDIAIDTKTEESRSRDELRRVVRRRVMATYLRENSNKQKPSTRPESLSAVDQRHEIGIVSCGNSVNPFNTAPIKLEAYMYDLLQFCKYPLYSHSSTDNISLVTFYTDAISVSKTLYSIEDKAEFNPMREYWLPMAFHDSALLHVFIGFADMFMVNGNSTSIQSADHLNQRWLGMRHLNEATSIVNKRMSHLQGTEVSNETLAAIATIAMIQKCNGMHNQWRIHMKGLGELVRARGGLNSLISEPLILGKLYRFVATVTPNS